MVFSSYIFVVWFLPLFLIVYYAAPARHRALCLTLGSYVFYGWWRPEYCALLAGITAVNYYCGALIARADSARARKRWLVVSVAASLGVQVSVIGEVVEAPSGVQVSGTGGRSSYPGRTGWDHFAQA